MLKEYKSILPYMKNYVPWYIAGLTMLLLANAGQLLIPQFVKRAVDTIKLAPGNLQLIQGYALTIVGIAFVIAVARFGWRFFIHGASRRIESTLRERLFEHLLKLSGNYYSENKTGDLMARATNDMRAIRMATGMGFVAAFDGSMLAIAILFILFGENARVALITIIPFPFLTVFILFFGRQIGSLFKEVQEGFSKISEESQEALSGVRVIKSFVKEDYFLDKFVEANEVYRQRNMKLVRLWGLFFPLIAFISGLTTLILLLFGGNAVLALEMTTGEFIAIMSYLGMLTWPMLGAGFTVNVLQRGAASLSRINQVLNTVPDIADPEDPIYEKAVGDLEVKNLSFSYKDSQEAVLKGLNFCVEKGQILGILGKTGSGKSTLVKLFSRQLDPPGGSILIGGHDVRQYHLQSLRACFGMVPQETFLFSRNVYENICFGVDSCSAEDVAAAAELSTITRDLDTFPKGMETLVGEKGTTLSGGQKQRLAISRALLTDPEILVFDDALSAVDTETEGKIIQHILENRRNKTTIIISHRISAFAEADNVLVLEDGKISQEGTHEELIRQDGFYAEIYHLQNKE